MKRLFFALLAFLFGTGISQAQLEDGTLIFLENSKWIVEQYTDSPTAHVAFVMNEDGVPWVYEAEPPAVRRVKLSDYYEELASMNKDRRVKIKMYVLRPSQVYSELEILEMKKFADKEVGRRYSIKGYIRNKPVEGTHCSQLTANMLNTTNRFNFSRPYAISPALLRSLVDPEYSDGVQVYVKETRPEVEKSWRQASWDWVGTRLRWCGWTCRETWSWCW